MKFKIQHKTRAIVVLELHTLYIIYVVYGLNEIQLVNILLFWRLYFVHLVVLVWNESKCVS